MNLVNSYPGMKAPSFRPEIVGDCIYLHYYSSRPTLAPYATGILVSIAKVIYKLDVSFEHYQKKIEGKDHDIFIVHLPEEEHAKVMARHNKKKELARTHCSLRTRDFDRLFPWHLKVDHKLRVLSIGSQLQFRFQEGINFKQVYFHNMFKLLQPSLLKQNFEALKGYAGHRFQVIVRDDFYTEMKRYKKEQKREAKRTEFEAKTGKSYQSGGSSSSASSAEVNAFITQAKDNLYISGEIVYLKDDDSLLFVGVPFVSSAQELFLRGIELGDIPMHSNGREMLFSTAHQTATVSVATKLDDTSRTLLTAQKSIDEEKERVYTLLHGILPAKVAEALERGETPEVEKFPAISLLYADVPCFDKIVGSVKPAQVMGFLNEVFSKFDQILLKYGAYKVESIGGSYMVACGIPEPMHQHAGTMCQIAIEMVKAAETVLSPIDATRVQLRIGMHCGKVIAGVVGKTRPRYNLLGDVVNTTNQLANLGVAGTIHLSSTMMKAVMADGTPIQYRRRGQVHIKGVGKKTTVAQTWQWYYTRHVHAALKYLVTASNLHPRTAHRYFLSTEAHTHTLSHQLCPLFSAQVRWKLTF
eukprot:m.54954 g.54954  ORF g.54954 m.54954 type:complete len:584 (-) comp11459_c0_seq7:633-2384(-)